MAMSIKTKRKKAPAARARKSGAGAVEHKNGYRVFSRLFNTAVDGKDAGSIIKGYVRKAYDKESSQAILKNPEWKWNTQATASWCYWTSVHMDKPFAKGSNGPCSGSENDEDDYNQSTLYYGKKFADLIESGMSVVLEQKAEEKKKANTYVPSIQDRMAEQLGDIVAEFDEWIDLQPSKDIPKMFTWLTSNSVAQAHINKIRAYYEPIHAEYVLLSNMPTPAKIKKMSEQEQDEWEQIKEGYAFLSKDDIKCYLKWFDTLFADLDSYANVKKQARKSRVKKAPSVEKLISKLKYSAEDSRYKVVSISPASIIGAQELWVFNTKNRKLGKYVAEMHNDLSIKGTTLLNFDVKLSVQKTLRKPEEQLKTFGKSGKVALRKFLEDIKATETKMNGRINEHTVLLKVS